MAEEAGEFLEDLDEDLRTKTEIQSIEEDPNPTEDIKKKADELNKRLNVLEAKIESSKQQALTNIEKKIGLEPGSIKDALADCQKQGGPTTDAGKKLQDFVNDFQGNFIKWMEEHEQGFFEKHSGKLLLLMMVLGACSKFGSYLLQKYNADENAACYSMTTCDKNSNTSTIRKVPCNSKDTCTCNRITQCGLPPCGDPSTKCLQYYWGFLDLETLVASIPDIADITYNAPDVPDPGSFKNHVLLFLAVCAILIFIGYMTFKLYEKYH